MVFVVTVAKGSCANPNRTRSDFVGILALAILDLLFGFTFVIYDSYVVDPPYHAVEVMVRTKCTLREGAVLISRSSHFHVSRSVFSDYVRLKPQYTLLNTV